MVHLHLHSDFSLLDGASKVDNYIKLAQDFNHKSMTILDHGSMSGTFEFYTKCKAAGIKPILGMESYLNDSVLDKSDDEEHVFEGKDTHQSILIMNQDGYVNLNKLTYKSFTEGYYRRGRITTEWLIENKNGLLITTSCMASKFARLVQDGKFAEAEERLKLLMREFGDNLVAELQFNEIPEQKTYNHWILRMIKKYSLMPILTGDVHYSEKEDARLQDVLISINQHKTINDPKAFRLQARHLNYTNADDFFKMNKEFGFNYPDKFIHECLDNTLKVADKCNFDFETDKEKYPKYEPTKDVIEYFKPETNEELITKLAHAKLNQKFKIYEKNGIVEINDEVKKKYRDRLDYELKVIKEKKFSDYFLVVWELIRFCKDNEIMTGPGRGSVCGSLLAWAIDITKVDAIRFNLYFERFLNPTRKSQVDIDTDFESGTDEKTLNFLYEKYGKERVVPIITFGTFNEKGCIKDVVRALGGETGFESDVFAVTREMPEKWQLDGKKINLREWFEAWPQHPECSPRVKSWLIDPDNKEAMSLTLKLQGQVRNLGKHASGLVITPEEIWKFLPVNICKGQIVSGFQESGNAKDLSTLGILKLDRLNLSTLNIIKEAIRLVKENKGIDIQEQVDYVNLKDENLFIELRMGNNQGIFQFESEGINALVKGIKVENFDEVVATNALYRPGAMNINAHTDYIKNKFNPTERTYAHPSLAPLLEETNGVLIYQEQLMFIAEQIGGMTLGEGDSLRKQMDSAGSIIAKKLSGEPLDESEKNNKAYKEYNTLWTKFIEGAKTKGLSEEEVTRIEDWLVKYLGYSFNKCLSSNHTVYSKTRGEVNLLDVKIDEEILGFNTKTKNNQYNKIKNIHKNGQKKVYRLKTSSGHTLECTLDHKIMTEHGMHTLSGIIKDNLKILTIPSHENIITYEEIGEVETYDLEIDSDDHNFYANDICVSNSHSLAYSYIAMQTLFLKHYYPIEFYTALLNNQKNNADKEKEKQWLQAVLLAAMSKGIEISSPTRKSKWEWTIVDNNKIAMGFSGINGMGEIAFEEMQRKNFANLSKDEFFSTHFSKFNKGSFEACLKAGLFDDWSPSREEILEWRKAKIANTMQLDIFGNHGVDTKTVYRKFLKTTDELKHISFIEVCNLDLKLLKKIFDLKQAFITEYNMNIEPVTNFEDPKKYYYFCLNQIEERFTKTGKKMYSMHLSDGATVKKVMMWDNMYRKLASTLERDAIYITKFIKDKGWLSFNAAAEFRKVF